MMECKDNCVDHHAALLRGLDEGTIELADAKFCNDCQNHMKALRSLLCLIRTEVRAG